MLRKQHRENALVTREGASFCSCVAYFESLRSEAGCLTRRYLPAKCDRHRLRWMCCLAVVVWLSCATVAVQLMEAVKARAGRTGLQATAATAVAVHLLLGLVLVRSHVTQPKVGRWPTLLQLLQRGGVTSGVWLLVLGAAAQTNSSIAACTAEVVLKLRSLFRPTTIVMPVQTYRCAGTTEAYPAAAGVLLLIPLWSWSVWVVMWHE